MFKEKHILFFLFLLLIIYFAHSALSVESSIISQGTLSLYLGISGIYYIKTLLLRDKKTVFFKAWTALLLLNIIGFIFTGRISDIYHFSMFAGVLLSLLTFYPFYYFARKNILESKHLIIFFLVILPIFILQYLNNMEQILSARMNNNTDLVNNVAYSFVFLIPFVFLIKKKIISIICMLVLMLFIIEGAKRGAIITGGVGLLMYAYFQLRTVNKRNRAKGYLLTVLGLIVLGYFAYKFYITNDFLRYRMGQISETGGSGRIRIYTDIWEGWFNSGTLLNILFGFGFGGSQKLTGGMFAHNDWLELISNFGLLGVIAYIMLFFTAYKLIRSSNWGDTDKRLFMLTVFIMWLLITLFSMGYTSGNGYLRAIILAYLIGNRNKALFFKK